MIKISIVVPIYNIERYVKKCVNSLINQTYKNIEIILVDDGSTDRSSVICDEYSKKYKNIIVIHQKNQGLSAARNCAVRKATGEYIMFVDGDDWIEEKTVEILKELMEKNGADISSIIKVGHHFESGELIIGNSYKMLLHMLYKSCFEIWGKLFKRKLFENIEFPVGKIHEDLYTLPQIVTKADVIVVYHKGLYNYRHRQDSIMACAAKDYYYDLVQCCIEGVKTSCFIFEKEEEREDLEKFYMYHILWYYYNVVCIADEVYYKKASRNIGLFYKEIESEYWKNTKISYEDKCLFAKLSELY